MFSLKQKSNPSVFCLPLLAMSLGVFTPSGNASETTNTKSKIEIVPLKCDWKWRFDSEKVGDSEKWESLDFDDQKWDEIEVTDKGWGQETGIGWYRGDFEIPENLRKFKHLYIFFGGVDEESTISINGEQAFVCDWQTMKTNICGTWNLPFSFSIEKFVNRSEKNKLALRVYNRVQRGGIYKPVYLAGSDTPVDALQIGSRLIELDKMTQKEHDLAFGTVPAPPPAENEEFFGARIQRTMTLLRTSNAKRRRQVKILFYGQSITAGLQWPKIIDQLQKRYPYAEIIAENRAIGGFTAPNLVRIATHDLYTFYPDLVVFHVYGKYDPLERIIYNIRKYTTSEIMLYTHHIGNFGERQEFTDERHDEENDFYHYLAQKYNCELVEVRKEWRQYLEVHKIPNNELMGDTVRPNIHPNRRGHSVLAQLIARHFRYTPLFPGGWFNTVKTYEAARSIEEKNDEITFTGKAWRKAKQGVIGTSSDSALKLDFTGNRIDLIAFPCSRPGTAKILIDGKPASEIPELYYFTRPDDDKVFCVRPPLKRISLGDNPSLEKWTMKLTEESADGKKISFEIVGSVTGPDGKGDNSKDFVSNSGKIRISRKDFNFTERPKVLGGPIPVGYEVTWECKLAGMDVWKSEKLTDPTREYRFTLAQGLDNGPHTIEIIPNGDGSIPVKSLVVFEPPLK